MTSRSLCLKTFRKTRKVISNTNIKETGKSWKIALGFGYFFLPDPKEKIGSQGLHVATALESSHTRKRDTKRWQLLWTECVSGQSPAFTLYMF